MGLAQRESPSGEALERLELSSYPGLDREDGPHPINVVALAPGGRNQVSVALVRVQDELQASATFFPIVEAEQVRSALQHALDGRCLSLTTRRRIMGNAPAA